MVELVYALVLSISAWAQEPLTTARVYQTQGNGPKSHLWLVDHSSRDTTSFEVQSITRLIKNSCELLLDQSLTPRLDPRVDFSREQLTLAARDALYDLNLGALGTRIQLPSLEEAWRQILAAADNHLATQLDAYATARAEGDSLGPFGPIELIEEYHLAAQILFGSEFSNAGLVDATQAWFDEYGEVYRRTYGLMRAWARYHLPHESRGASDVNAGHLVTPTMEKLDHALLLIGNLLPAEQTASNFWNQTVSMYLRQVLAERYFTLPVQTYDMIRAILDKGDRISGVRLDDHALLDRPPAFEAQDNRIAEALRRGGAFVLLDPVRHPVIGRLRARGLDLEPLNLRGAPLRMVK